jgi:hypothetical protein
MARNIALGLVTSWLVGCAGGATPAQAPTAPSPATQAQPPPPPDLSPVPAPSSLVLSGRLGKPSASLAVVRGWTKLPMPQSEQLTEILTSEAVGPLVDLDQPVDFAVAVVGSGAKMRDLTAMSAAVKDPEKAKASLAERYKLVPGDNGALVVVGLGKPKGKQEDEDGDDDGKPSAGEAEAVRACELAPAFGEAPVRIVCGWSSKALEELAPWLTRTAPRMPPSADLHLDAHMAPLKPTIAEQKRLLGTIVGGLVSLRVGLSWLREVAMAVGTDVVDLAMDLDGASLDVTLADAGVEATLGLKLSGNSSGIGRLLVGRADRNGPPPAAFWQLPGDADFALFGRGVDEAELAKARDLLLRVVAYALREEGVKEGDSKPIVDSLGKLVSPAAAVYGSGVDAGAVRKAVAADRGAASLDPAERAEAWRQLVEALLGWRVIELDEPSVRIVGALKDLSTSLGKPSIAAALRARDKDVGVPALRPMPVAKAAGLPGGTQHYVLELPRSRPSSVASGASQGGHQKTADKKATPAKPLQVHIYVAPDGQHTWLGVGGDEGLAAARLSVSLATAGDKLASRADLAPLKDQSVGTGGFMTVRGLPETIEAFGLVTSGVRWDGIEMVDEAAQMPHQGLTPVLLSTTPQAGSAPAAVVMRLQVPKDAIEDLVGTILRHGGF